MRPLLVGTLGWILVALSAHAAEPVSWQSSGQLVPILAESGSRRVSTWNYHGAGFVHRSASSCVARVLRPAPGDGPLVRSGHVIRCRFRNKDGSFGRLTYSFADAPVEAWRRSRDGKAFQISNHEAAGALYRALQRAYFSSETLKSYINQAAICGRENTCHVTYTLQVDTTQYSPAYLTCERDQRDERVSMTRCVFLFPEIQSFKGK